MNLNLSLDLKPLHTVDERLMSYNVEMTEVTGGTFWKAYTPGQIVGTEEFRFSGELRDFTAMPDLMQYYTKYTFSMFGGETVPVTMVFQNRMMGAVMDRFGRDVVVMKEDERHFRVTVSVAVSNQFYGWVFGLGKSVRIIGPERVKKGMKKALADIAARYED